MRLDVDVFRSGDASARTARMGVSWTCVLSIKYVYIYIYMHISISLSLSLYIYIYICI